MQKDKRFAYVALGLACLSAGLLAGCTRGRSDLAKETANAQRLFDRACSLLNDVPYQINGKYAPLATKMNIPDDPNAKPNPVQLAPEGTINPQADQAIKQAIDSLSKALSAADGQPEFDKLTARAMLARLYALRGYRMALAATAKQDQVRQAAAEVENYAVIISGLGKRIQNYDDLLSVTDESLAKVSTDAKSSIADLQKKMADHNGKIATLEKEKAELVTSNNTLMAAARKLRVDSRLADPIKGVDLFDQARAKEDQAGKNSARISVIDDSVATTKAELKVLEQKEKAAETLLSSANSLASDRATRQAQLQKDRSDRIAELTTTQDKAKAQAAKVVDLIKAAADDLKKAAADYDTSISKYQAYQATTTKNARDSSVDPFLTPDPAIIAMLGDTMMSRADLRVEALLLQHRLNGVVAETSKIWQSLPVQNSVPPVIGQMKDFLADAGKAMADAKQDFRWAAKAYQSAGDAVSNPNLRWAYVLQQAGAETDFYRISGDQDFKQKATKDLDSLGKQEGSPLIAPAAADFRNSLKNPPLTLSEGK